MLILFVGALLVATFTWTMIYGRSDGSNWTTVLGLFLLYIVSIPLVILLLWQVERWVLRGFRSN